MSILKSFFNILHKLPGTSEACSTRMIDDRFFECLVKKPNPNYCEHSLCSGDGFICNHQDREIYTRK